jgi:uncharacterized membrane protein required for colicin V production
MHGFDLAVAASLALCAYRGYARGLFQEVMSLFALALAVIAAFRWTPDVVPRLAQSIPGPSFFDTAVVFSALFAVTGIALRILVSIVSRSAARSSTANRVGGAAFSAARGAMVIGSVVLTLRSFTPTPLPGSANTPSGPLQQLNGRLADSFCAAHLARLSSAFISAFVDAPEIRLRMLATSDNEWS